ncbi:hypothetical protein [Paraburkholderia fungorum]|jgi:hypothetical protein|uniref:Uncharacterized protein n=1 Tax=Paraburkholderia fungorum TaxID=134537 RepID=A0AAW3V5G0_9BURK|nr:hypothetical protein [Paraburkholderia fungorum]AJZ56120.1 hypothetical protein OI25_8043 [Paraburkholderia fungorum]MBB4516352.1 hypothetical protein [Paraburkholderia fungorum]MBB5546738.1 hypothetical protein [Paraburkholderia fungorum]MBB6205176.1 hypothetical protein [Paraburkholderia fungorum]MBU7440776.1 hypothetical protein [Paraburkholderia fungorum]
MKEIPFFMEADMTEFQLNLLRTKIAEALLKSEELRQSTTIRSPVAKAHHERLDAVLEETKALLGKLTASDI